MQHGLSKYFGFPASAPQNFQMLSLLGLAGAIEIIGGLMLALGLYMLVGGKLMLPMPAMRARHEGAIVTIGSISGRVAVPMAAPRQPPMAMLGPNMPPDPPLATVSAGQ